MDHLADAGNCEVLDSLTCTSVFQTADVRKKVSLAPAVLTKVLRLTRRVEILDSPSRDVPVVSVSQMPDKKGLSQKCGLQRLLHDLAGIELQAYELCLRTLCEFPDAPQEFRQSLADLAVNEAQHLTLCLDSLESLGGNWGQFPTHLQLWNCVDSDEDLLDRIVIVHLYLEGSGLDAGAQFVRRLAGLQEGFEKAKVQDVVHTILSEEIGHVNFGTAWFKRQCLSLALDSDREFSSRMASLQRKVPRRLEKIDRDLRRQAGFSLPQIEVLERLRSSMCNEIVKVGG